MDEIRKCSAMSGFICVTKMDNHMKKEIKYWLLPLEGLQAGTRYHNSIPDDSPELMPLDETLNMDIHLSARYHVAITAHLCEKRPQEIHFLNSKGSVPRVPPPS
jgi:hypothetical protein